MFTLSGTEHSDGVWERRGWLDDAFPNMYRVSVSDTLACLHQVPVPPVHAAPTELAV